MAGDWPDEAHGIPIPLDNSGNPRLFVLADRAVGGVKLYRRMTEDEVTNWVESKTGQTKVRPAEIDGEVP
jgi:hypothetical protein